MSSFGSWRVRAMGLALPFVVLACGGSDAPAGIDGNVDSDAGPSDAGPSDAGPVVADEQAAACAAQTAALQEKLDASHGAKTDVVLAVKDEACGYRYLTSGPAQLAETRLHRIGSVTKTYVAAVVLRLADDGLLSIEDPISKYIDGIPNGDGILIRHLLNHSSGIFNYAEDADFMANATKKDASVTPRELVDAAIAHDPYFAPGTGWHYSNTNYVLLGMLVEQLGKADVASLIRRRVLEPVGLTVTFFDGVEPVVGDLAIGRSRTGADVTHAHNLSWAWAAGAMVATPKDVVTWIEALATGGYYDATTQAKVMETIPTSSSVVGYGLGVMVLEDGATGGIGRGVGHSGDIPGYHTQAFYLVDKRTTVVVINDTDKDPTSQVAAGAFEVLFGAK